MKDVIETTPQSARVAEFALLFDGRRDAYGTGEGRWVKRALTLHEYAEHLDGRGPGIGVAPLRDDGTVYFAAVDLDEPDFGFAREVAGFLPGCTWIERSRSGNAHVWSFFSDKVEAWVPRGIMLSALESLGRNDVEVFPKQDRLRPGMLGNYINLPYHGSERPMIHSDGEPYPLAEFLELAHMHKNDPEDWRRRARAMGVQPPEERPGTSEWGTRETPHACAMYIYERRHTNPIQPGHRAVVLFSLAKQFLNWRAISHQRAHELVQEVNAASPEPVPDREVLRIVETAIRGQYTSTGCDDPLMRDYVRPECPIAND